MNITHVVIIGYGSQAKAWAQNLRDSNIEVTILLRDGSQSLAASKKDGFITKSFQENLEDLKGPFIVLTPDHTHKMILLELSSKIDLKDKNFIFAHGYSTIAFNFKATYPSSTFLLLAPKAIASEVRARYLNKEMLVGVLAFDDESSKNILENISKNLGITKVIEASFEDETYADLFSEQTLLCSLLPYGARKSFEFLVDKGIHPEVAFTECWMEVKLIADAMLNFGPEGFIKLISPNALLGGEKATSMLFDNEYQTKLDSLWGDIKSGKFNNEVESTDISSLRENVLKDWRNSPITDLYKVFIGEKND